MSLNLVVCKPRLRGEYHAQAELIKTELCGELGAPIMHMPAFELVPSEEALEALSDKVKVNSEKPAQVLVFVSPSALEFGLAQLKTWPEAFFCGLMGAQSAKLAKQLGVPASQIIAPDGVSPGLSEDSEGLYKLIADKFPSGAADILVCKGPRGRADFPERLRQAGYSVQELECYDRVAIEHDPSFCQHIADLGSKAVLWVTSSEAATVVDESFANTPGLNLEKFRRDCQILTTHSRIAAKCKELGYAHVQIIPTGIQSVKDWFILNNNKAEEKKIAMSNEAKAPVPDTNQASSDQDSARKHEASHGLLKMGFVLSVLSFVLLLVLIFAGKNQIEQTRLAFGERIQQEATILNVVKDQVKESNDLYKDLKTRFDMLDERQKEASSQRDQLQDIYNKLLANRSAVSLSEIEQLVSIAKRQLFLLGNVKGAILALSQASDLLSRSEDPSMIRLRNAVDKDLAEIKALPSVDLLSLAISLDSVINSVPTLPMLSGGNTKSDMTLAQMTDTSQTQASASDPSTQSTASPSESKLSKAWADVKDALGLAWHDVKGLIQITKVDTPEAFLLSTQQAEQVRNTLELSLLNARLSLLSRHSELLQSDLQRSDKILETYFDPKAAQVKRAKAIIKELNNVQLNLALPELQNTSAALNLAIAAEEGSK